MVMTDELLLGFSLLFILGVGGYWLAWQLRLPALVILFLVGMLAGPRTGLVDPDTLLGPVLFPAISLALGLILFQGGLMLRLDDLPEIGALTLRLLLIGAPLTAAAAAGLAYFLVTPDIALAVLLGSLLVLPAPTVLGPLLDRVRVRGRVGPALKWEATVISPIGAAVAILLFEAVLAGDLSQATGALFFGVGRALAIGTGLGIVGGFALQWLLDKERVVDPLRNSVVVLVLLVTLLVANWLQPEAGLLAMPVAGIVFANQNRVAIGPVVSFMDSLHILFAGPLLLILAARLDPALFTGANWPSLLLFTGLILVAVRPLAMLIAGWRSPLGNPKKLFMGWTAPRGAVPVALGTIFALELSAVGHAGAELLAFVPVIFTLLTAAIVWVIAGPLADRLQLITVAMPDAPMAPSARMASGDDM